MRDGTSILGNSATPQRDAVPVDAELPTMELRGVGAADLPNMAASLGSRE